MALRKLILLYNYYPKIKNVFIFPTYYSGLKIIMAKKVNKLFYNFICMSTQLSRCQESVLNRDKDLESLKGISHCKANGLPIPENITEEQYQCLQEMKFYQQLKYINFLLIKEKITKNKKIKRKQLKESKKLEREQRKKQFAHIEYGYWKNCMFVRTGYEDMLNLYHHQSVSSMMHNQAIIFDLSFEDTMNSRKDKLSLASQLSWCIAYNRKNLNPCNITFCNVRFQSETIKYMKKMMPRIFKQDIPMNISSETYLNLFPKKKLVYLTPDAADEMGKIDSEAVYIIGGIVDHGCKNSLTLIKAKQEGIRTQKFPLDRYLEFRGHKSLNIQVVLAVILKLQETGDWKKALENVPRRLVKTASEKSLSDDELHNCLSSSDEQVK